MVSINGWAFMFIGAGMAFVAYFLVDELWMFTYIGGAFFAYGLLKVIINRLRRPRKKKAHDTYPEYAHSGQEPDHRAYRPGQQQHPHYALSPQSQYQHQATSHHQKAQQSQHQHPLYCRSCGARLRLHDNFCPHCGLKLG
jgi:hypothetical protein